MVIKILEKDCPVSDKINVQVNLAAFVVSRKVAYEIEDAIYEILASYLAKRDKGNVQSKNEYCKGIENANSPQT